MSRARYRTRMYIWECTRCERWQSVKTLEQQRVAKAKGICMDCEGKRKFRLELYMHIVAQHLDELVAKGKAAPEEKREVFRRLYRKRQRQFLVAKEEHDLVLI